MRRVRWDIYCRVIDNFGDIGVCWRLARELASRDERVRLVADDLSALRWMAPRGAPGVTTMAWADATDMSAEVVIEAFGAHLPDATQTALARRAPSVTWINLEHLSAERYVERSHGLPSPQLHGPAAGATKHFFFPGFTPATGGLLREGSLIELRATFDRDTWLGARGWARRRHERVVVLFGYPQPSLRELLGQVAAEPTLLLLAGGPLQAAALETIHDHPRHRRLRTVALPFLSQPEFDRLLWSADLAFVRGEDSPVRAIWAAVPFIWQLYPQPDGAQAPKLEAFLERLLVGAPARMADTIGAFFRAWNSARPGALHGLQWPDPDGWRQQVQAFRSTLLTQPDLATQLQRFVASRR
jgi:uncharacterized repeat protein (TIGR03837 family)